MHTVDLSTFRGAIPYLRAYKGRTFVVKLGGGLCSPGPVLDHVIEQCALLHQLGIQLILVHGGGEQMNALSAKTGLAPRIVAGRRVTDAETLRLATMVFAGSVHTDVLASCRARRLSAIGLSGVDAGLIRAVRRPVQRVQDGGATVDVDYGYVGDVAEVNPAPLLHLMSLGYVPVVCSLAADDAGQVYNVNADTVASALAVRVEATKYFLLTTVDGVLADVNNPATLFSQLSTDEVGALIERGVISGGMLPKIRACLDALTGGVDRVHIINGVVRDTLLGEVFTNAGCGTLIVGRRGVTSDGIGK
ncbi:MAG: Acetylglutamate kinase [Phycisphaerae bacterium]|nr:Acetylglutamate kinase [Phycisphaerae bacterium]